MVMMVMEHKQTMKKLDDKAAEMAKAKKAAYNVGMTKIVESFIAQLRDVAWAFCLEVWGQALNVVRVSTESKLKASDKVYFPSTLRLAPTSQQPPVDPSSTPPVSSDQPTFVPFSTPTKGKEQGKELPPPTEALDVETKEEVVEVSQLKRKKREKEQEKNGAKKKEPSK